MSISFTTSPHYAAGQSRAYAGFRAAGEPPRPASAFATCLPSTPVNWARPYGAHLHPSLDGQAARAHHATNRAQAAAARASAGLPHATRFAPQASNGPPAADASLWSVMCALPITVVQWVGWLLCLPWKLVAWGVGALLHALKPRPQTHPHAPWTAPRSMPMPAAQMLNSPTWHLGQSAESMREGTFAPSVPPDTRGDDRWAAVRPPDITRQSHDCDWDWDYAGRHNDKATTHVVSPPTHGEKPAPAPTAPQAIAAVPYANPPICPISFVPLTHAVTTLCDHAFDEAAMRLWLEQGNTDCPCCQAPVRPDTLRDDHLVRAFAASWSGAHGLRPSPVSPAPRPTALDAWAEQARRDIFPHPPECPISAEPLTQAATTPCGHSFQKTSILQWVLNGNPSCPCCRAPVYASGVRDNKALNAFTTLWLQAGSPQTIPAPAEVVSRAQPHLSPQALGMPDALTCAFSRLPLRDPVKAPCGHTFERSSIIDVLQSEQRCPLDGQASAPDDLISDAPALRAVVDWQLKTLRGMPPENWDAIYFAEEFAYA